MVYDWFQLSNYGAGLGQKPHTGAKIQIIESRESIKKEANLTVLMPFLFLAKSQGGQKILKVKDPLKSFKHSVHVFKFSNLAEDHAIQPKIAAHVRILMP